jgi:hypothetical protein
MISSILVKLMLETFAAAVARQGMRAPDERSKAGFLSTIFPNP